MTSSLLVKLGGDTAAGPIAVETFEISVQTDFRDHEARVEPMFPNKPQNRSSSS